MEGCNYTNSFGMDSTRCKQKKCLVPGTSLQLFCLQLSSTWLVTPSSGLASSVCLGKVILVHRRITILQHRLQGKNVFSFVCWAR